MVFTLKTQSSEGDRNGLCSEAWRINESVVPRVLWRKREERYIRA